MTTLTTQVTIAFEHPFTLDGLECEQPPGHYLVETVEKEIRSVSPIAYQRIATTIALPSVGSAGGLTQVVTIDPSDLAAARRRDFEPR